MKTSNLLQLEAQVTLLHHGTLMSREEVIETIYMKGTISCSLSIINQKLQIKHVSSCSLEGNNNNCNNNNKNMVLGC